MSSPMPNRRSPAANPGRFSQRFSHGSAHPVRRRPVGLPGLLGLGVLGLGLALGGCASRDTTRSGLFEPYRVDIPQGNYVTQQMLDQVKDGMTREQVRFALGSPLLTNPFRTDQWDYVYRYQHANGRADVRRVVIQFAENRVSRIQSDALPQRDDNTDPALPGYRGTREYIPANESGGGS